MFDQNDLQFWTETSFCLNETLVCGPKNTMRLVRNMYGFELNGKHFAFKILTCRPKTTLSLRKNPNIFKLKYFFFNTKSLLLQTEWKAFCFHNINLLA